MDGLATTARFLGSDGRIHPGVKQPFAVANPAAGSDWSVTVPGGVMWRVVSAIARFTTSATVANRSVSFTVMVDGLLVYRTAAFSPITASSAAVVSLLPGSAQAGAAGTAGLNVFNVPDTWLTPGCVLSSLTGGIDPADQYSAIAVWIEELYFTNAKLAELAELRVEDYYAAESAALAAANPTATTGG